jgi:hypothetical protein
MGVPSGPAAPADAAAGGACQSLVVTKALEAAFQLASNLPDEEQEALAEAILAEVAFDALIASRPDAPDRLADEALEEYRAGRTLPLDPDDR